MCRHRLPVFLLSILVFGCNSQTSSPSPPPKATRPVVALGPAAQPAEEEGPRLIPFDKQQPNVKGEESQESEGAAQIRLEDVSLSNVCWLDPSGQGHVGSRSLMLRFRIENHHATLRQRYECYGEKTAGVKMEDEHGNSYNILQAPLGCTLCWDYGKGVMQQSNLAMIEPKRAYTDVLYFEVPAKVATKLTFTFPRRNVGGTGSWVFANVPVPKPVANKE